MPATFSDVLLAPAATIAGQWIQVVNNATGVGYVSTGPTTSPTGLTGGGVYTFNPGPPGGIYTVYTSPVQLAPLAGGWNATGNTNYVIAYTAGDDMVMHSGTAKQGSPYAPSALSVLLAGTGASVVEGKVWLPQPSGGDDAASWIAILAALVTANIKALTLYAWPGLYHLASMVTFPKDYNLIGDGNGDTADTPGVTRSSTHILCTAAGAGLTFVDTGGRSGDFVVDGNAIANYPFTRGPDPSTGFYGSARTWICLDVGNAVLDNVTINGAQNELWLSCSFGSAGRDNMVLDYGAGGNSWLRCEFNDPGRHNLTVQRTAAGPFPVPSQNSFWGCDLEGVPNAENINLLDAQTLGFTRCWLEQTYHGIQVQVKATGGRTSNYVSFQDSQFSGTGNAADIAIHVDAGCDVSIGGQTVFVNETGGAFDIAATGSVFLAAWPEQRINTPLSSATSANSPLGLTVSTPATVTGDKLNFTGTGASGIGFGIQSAHLVAYLGSGVKFAVRAASASGAMSSGSDVWSVDGSGNVIVSGAEAVTGALSVTAAPFTLTGGQVAFPSTQNPSAGANTLDDYQESLTNTLALGISFGGSNTGITYGSQVGFYTKIGRLVIFAARITLTSKGVQTGSALITGLPYTAASGTIVGAVSLVNFANLATVASGHWILGKILQGSTTAALFDAVATGGSTSFTDAYFTNTTDLQLSGFYLAGA